MSSVAAINTTFKANRFRTESTSLIRGLLLSFISLAIAGSAVAQLEVDPLEVEGTTAKTAKEMKGYGEKIEHTEVKIDMVPIPGGTFMMGSPDDEDDRKEDEGPQHEVEIAPFWMSKFEITWDAYEVWMFDLDLQMRKFRNTKATVRDKAAEEYQLSQPTKPYTDMTFGMGKKGYPAICMTQLSARTFCNWLSTKTGRYYRLPTEAEWEYACRAGTKTAYSFGDDPDDLEDFAWYYENSEEQYQPVGKKKPNPWGLHDMHGNVSEWVLDEYKPKLFSSRKDEKVANPLIIPKKLYPRLVRGGSWDDDPDMLRSAARIPSTPEWKKQDPQFPKSIWYHTDALHVGFRIVRPLERPTKEEIKNKWDKSEPYQDRKRGKL